MHLLDTNILIGYLNGNKKIADWVLDSKKENPFSGLSISLITKIEVLSLKTLKDSQIDDIEKFLDIFHIVSINDEIINLAATLRRKDLLSLGDAIIAASAIYHKATLVTNDKDLAKKAKNFIEVLSI